MIRLLLITCLPASAQDMNNHRLAKIFETSADSLKGQIGAWEIWRNGLPMICITDQNHNRMRIMMPVKEVRNASGDEIMRCMEANFHTALDIKYAISDAFIWVVFIHPLNELTIGQVMDAMDQIQAGYITYGTIYSSTELAFPKSEDDADDGVKRG